MSCIYRGLHVGVKSTHISYVTLFWGGGDPFRESHLDDSILLINIYNAVMYLLGLACGYQIYTFITHVTLFWGSGDPFRESPLGDLIGLIDIYNAVMYCVMS